MTRRAVVALSVLAVGCAEAHAPPSAAPEDARAAHDLPARADAGLLAACEGLCRRKEALAPGCPGDLPLGSCLTRCAEEEASSPCTPERSSLEVCVAGVADPWLCIPGLGLKLRSSACPAAQAAYVGCMLGHGERGRPIAAGGHDG